MPDAPDIIILHNDAGERIGFEPLATVPYLDNTYMILRPVSPKELAEEGGVFVFAVSQVEGDQPEDSGSYLTMETDDAIADTVIDLYNKSL